MPCPAGFRTAARRVHAAGGLGCALWLALVAVSAPVAAEELPAPARRIHFGVEVVREVPNDWIRAQVGISAEHSDPADLAAEVNRSMGWALELARAEKGVRAESGGYDTQPVYAEGRLRRWRATQTLWLESSDAAAMTALVGRLQERLQLHAFEFSVARETRARVEQELIAEALAAFRARAEQIRRGLEAAHYEIDEVTLGSSDTPPGPLHARASFAAESASAPPEVEGGSSLLRVSANGSIRLR